MKKLKVILIVGVALLLVGCGSRMRGASLTVCEGGFNRFQIGEVTLVIEGYDEDIISWTERSTMDRGDYIRAFWGGAYVTETDIIEWFSDEIGVARYIQDALRLYDGDGVTWRLITVDADTVVTELHFDYTEMTERDIAQLWDTGNSGNHVTLSAAILGAEHHGANCN